MRRHSVLRRRFPGSGRPWATQVRPATIIAPARPTYAAPLVPAKKVLIISSPAIPAVSSFVTRTRNLQPQTLATPCGFLALFLADVLLGHYLGLLMHRCHWRPISRRPGVELQDQYPDDSHCSSG